MKCVKLWLDNLMKIANIYETDIKYRFQHILRVIETKNNFDPYVHLFMEWPIMIIS